MESPDLLLYIHKNWYIKGRIFKCFNEIQIQKIGSNSITEKAVSKMQEAWCANIVK